MAVNLETVVLELKANDKQFKQDINTSVSNAKQQLQKLENIPISLDVDISPIKKKINDLNKKGVSINVDHSPLVKLNDHLDKKKQHLTLLQAYFNSKPLTPSINFDKLKNLENEFNNLKLKHDATQQHFNSNPLTPSIDTINLKQLVNEFHGVITEHDATQQHFNANPLTPKADTSEIEKIINNLNELENHNNKTIELNFDAAANIGVEEFTEAIQQGAYEGTQEAQGGGGIFSRIDDIITGTFEGFGEEVSKDFYKGFSNKFRSRVTKSGSATEKYVGSRGKKIGESLIKNVGNYVGIDDFLKDIDVVGNAIDNFLDPQQFSKRLKNFEDNIVESLINIQGSSKIQPLSSKTASHRNVKSLPQQPLQEALDGNNNQEAIKYLRKAFTPPTEPIRRAATRAAGVGIKAGSQPFRIRKRVKLAESAQEVERQRANAEVFSEGIAKDAKSLTLSMGGIDFQEGAPNSDFSHNLVKHLFPGTASKPVYNTESQKLSGNEWTVQLRRVFGELRSEGNSQIKEQLTVVERIIEGLQGFVEGLDDQTKQQTHKAPENPLLERIYAAMQRSGIAGMSEQDVDEITSATPVDKILEAAIQTGSYPDAVKIATEAAANKEKYPDKPINVTGTSGGGYIVEEVVSILERMGYTGVKGAGFMSAPVGNTRTASAKNYRSYIGTGDYVAHATYGDRHIKGKDTDHATKEALKGTHNEYPFLKYFEGLFSPDPETTKLMAGSGIKHQLPTTLADSELAPDLEKFLQQGKISEDFKNVQAKTEIKEKDDISLQDIKKYIVKELGVSNEKEIKTGLQEIHKSLSKRDPFRKFLESEYGKKEKDRKSNIEKTDLRKKDTLYEIYKKMAEAKVEKNRTRGTSNFDFFRIMKDDFEGSFAPLEKSIKASFGDPETLQQLTPAKNYEPPFSFVQHGLNEEEQKEKIQAITEGGLRNVRKKAKRTSGEVAKYAERYTKFLNTFAEELQEFYESGEPLIQALRQAKNIGEFKQEKTPVFPGLKDYTPHTPEQQANLKFLEDEERDVEAIRRSIGASFADPTSLQEINQGEFTFADPKRQDPDKLRIFDELLQHKEHLQGQLSGKIGEHGEQYIGLLRQFRKELEAFHFGDDRHPIGESLVKLKELKEPKTGKSLSPSAEEISIDQWRVMRENIDNKNKLSAQGERKPAGFSNKQLFDIIQKPKNKKQSESETETQKQSQPETQKQTDKGEVLVEKLVNKLTEQLQKIIDNNIQQWQAVESQYKTIESQYELIQQQVKEVKKVLQAETPDNSEIASESKTEQQTETKQQPENKQQIENTEKQSETAASVNIDPEAMKQQIKDIEQKFEDPYQKFLNALKEGNIKLAEEYAKTFESVGNKAKEELDTIAKQYKEVTGAKGFGDEVLQKQGSTKGRITQKQKQAKKNLKKEKQRLQREANEESESIQNENLPQANIDLLKENKELIKRNWSETKKHIIEGLKELGSESKEQGYKIQRNVSEGSPGITQKIRKYWKATTNSIKNNINTLENRASEFAQSTKNTVGSSFENLQNKVSSFAQSTKNSINSLQTKVQNFSQGITSGIGGVNQQLKNRANDFKETVKNNISTLQNQANNFSQGTRSAVGGLGQQLKNKPANFAETANRFSQGTRSAIAGGQKQFKNQANEFREYIENYLGGLTSAVAGGVAQVREPQQQNQTQPQQPNMITSSNNNIGSRSAIGSMPTQIAPQPTTLQQKLKNQIKNFKQSTKSFAQGLNNQINNFAQSTRNTINNINPLNTNDENIFAGIKEKLKNLDIPKLIGDTLIAFGTAEGFQTISQQITDLGKSSIEAFLKLERLKIGLSFSNVNTEKTLESIKKETDKLGISFIKAAKGYKNFSSAVKGTNLENRKKEIFSGFTQSISAMQLGGERQKRVYTAISQIASKGVVSTEELRLQLGEQLPLAFNAAARAMGMTVKEFNKLVSTGNLLSEELLPKLAQQLQIETRETAKKSIGTLTFELQRLKNTIFEMKASTGEQLAAFLKPIIENVNKLIGLAKDNSNLFVSLSTSLLAVGSARVAGRFMALTSHFVDLRVLTKKIIQQLPKIQKGIKPVARSIKTFGLQVGALGGAIAAVSLAWKQAHLHQTEFDKGAANVADALKEVNNELSNTSDKLDQIGQKEFKLDGMQGWLDKAIAGLDKLDKKANSAIANILPGSKEFWRTDLSTGAEAKANNLKIDSTRQNSNRSQLINTLQSQVYNNEIMDNMVSELKKNNQKQKAVEAALINTEGDTAKEEKLRKRQKELIKARREIITNAIPGGKQTIKEQIDAVKGQISRMKELHGSKVPGKDKPLDFSAQIQRSEQQLKALQNALDEVSVHLEMASREANVLANQFKKIDSSFENKTFNISAAKTEAKQKVHKGFLEGNLNKEQYEKELNEIELRHQQTRLQNLRKYQEKYKNVFKDLNEVNKASLQKLLDGKEVEKAGIGKLKQAKEKAEEGEVSSNVKSALNRAIQIRNRTQEIEKLENQILKTKIQQREESGGIKDASEKIRDEMQKLKEARKQHQEKQKQLVSQNKDLVKESNKFAQSIRDFIRSTKEKLINIKKQIKETKQENAKLSIKNELSAIGGEVSSLFGSFEDVFAKSVAAQEKFDTTEQQKALTRMEAEKKTIDIARKIKDFQDQRKEIVKRGNELRKQYLKNERKYEQTKSKHWEVILKQHKKVQDQVGAIGKGMHKTAKGIIDQGNNLLKALHKVATNVNNTNINNNVTSSSTGSTGNIQNIDNIGEALFEAIINKESSGNYKAVNPDTGALGLGQVMPSNVASWTQQALGESLSPKEFLNDKQAQIETIEHKLSQYYSEALEKAGGDQEEAIRRVASKWYSGRGHLFDNSKSQGNYPSIRDYTLDVLDKLKNASGNFIGKAANKAKQFVQNNTTTDNNRVEDAVSQVMSQLQNQASSITFPVPGQSANDNLVGPGGMMDSYRNRGPGRPNRHNGIDYAYSTGTPLQAPISGTVQSVYSDKGEYGVKIRGQNQQGESVQVALNHLHSISENLKSGAKLQAGQKIGTVGGDQGSWGSTGSHLDLKVKINGQYVDPRDFFGNTKSAVASQVKQQTQQQAKAQISEFQPISLDAEKPVDTSTNIPEFSPINPRSLGDLPEFKNKISSAQDNLAEANQRNTELKQRQKELQIKNKIESIQTDIRDKIRETQHEIKKSTEETKGLIRSSGTVLTNEQKILEERKEISSKFDNAIRQRQEQIRQSQRQIKAEKERLDAMKERVKTLEDSERKTQLQETIKLIEKGITTQEEQVDSLQKEIELLENRKPQAIKENISLKKRELQLEERKFRTGLETEALDTQKNLLSTQNKNLYKQAELQKESALMQERLSHAEKILEIEKTIKDEQRQQELINLANQAHENRVAQIEAEKQQQIEQANRKKQKFTGNMQADLLQARAKATEFNPYKQKELEGQAQLIQHKLSTNQRKKELEEQIKLLDLNAQQAQKLRNQFQQLNQIKLNRIKQESNLLAQQVKNIAQQGFSTLFDSFAKVVRGTKSMGEAFRDFGLTVLKQISKIATKNLTNAVMGGIFGGSSSKGTTSGSASGGSGIFGSIAGAIGGGGGGIGSTIGSLASSLLFNSGGKVPNFAHGGEIDKAFGEGVGNIEDYLESENVNEIRNFATGGLIEAMKKEKAAGGKPIPIVASAGEQILPTKNGDAQFFREIQKKGLWEELKNGAISTLGNIKDIVGNEQPTSKIENYDSGGTINNKRFSTNNISNNTIKNKMDWTKPSFDAQALRSKTDWASQPMVSTSHSFENTQKTQSSNMRGETSLNINTPITVVAPKPEAYRKSAKQIASEQERQTQRAYKRFS